MLASENLFIEKHERYQRVSYRNRCHISGPNGLLRLSVPLKGGKSERQLITEKQIDYSQNWQKNHWESLCSCYRRSPYFEFYEDDLEPLFQERSDSLFELNLKTINWIIEALSLDLKVQFTDKFSTDYQDFTDMRSKILPNAMNIKGFRYPKYIQVFEARQGFIPNLSILDLLFAEGPSAKDILLSSYVNK